MIDFVYIWYVVCHWPKVAGFCSTIPTLSFKLEVKVMDFEFSCIYGSESSSTISGQLSGLAMDLFRICCFFRFCIEFL